MPEEMVQETEAASETAENEDERPEVDTNTSINSSLDEIEDAETLRKMVKKLRGENAKTRNEKNTTKEELDEFRKWKDSQLSEAEKLKARAEELEKKYLLKAREAVLVKHGIDPDDELAEFITGSEEEMEQKAERLAARLKRDAVQDPFRRPGGEPIKKDKNSGGDFLRGFA